MAWSRAGAASTVVYVRRVLREGNCPAARYYVERLREAPVRKSTLRSLEAAVASHCKRKRWWR